MADKLKPSDCVTFVLEAYISPEEFDSNTIEGWQAAVEAARGVGVVNSAEVTFPEKCCIVLDKR